MPYKYILLYHCLTTYFHLPWATHLIVRMVLIIFWYYSHFSCDLLSLMKNLLVVKQWQIMSSEKNVSDLLKRVSMCFWTFTGDKHETHSGMTSAYVYHLSKHLMIPCCGWKGCSLGWGWLTCHDFSVWVMKETNHSMSQPNMSITPWYLLASNKLCLITL